jgi:hypothetical protein
MRVVPLTPQQQADIRGLQNEYAAAQKAHSDAYRKFLTHLQTITGTVTDQGRKTKIAVDDTGQNIVVM